MGSQDRFYVDSDGIKLHYLEFGSHGPSLLLLPGITSPAITWAFVAQRLARDAHVYVLDQRGRGLSDQRPGLGHTTNDYASDAARVIEAIGHGPAILLGHSMGARVAARISAFRPDLVARCILADPPVSGPARRPYPSPIEWYLDEIDKAARGEPIQAWPNFSAEQRRMRMEWLPTCSREAVELSYRAMHEDDFFVDLRNVAQPTLVVYAGQGGVVTEADAEEISGALRNCEMRKVEHVGHMMPFDDLEAFLDAVTPFIAGV